MGNSASSVPRRHAHFPSVSVDTSAHTRASGARGGRVSGGGADTRQRVQLEQRRRQQAAARAAATISSSSSSGDDDAEHIQCSFRAQIRRAIEMNNELQAKANQMVQQVSLLVLFITFIYSVLTVLLLFTMILPARSTSREA